MNKPVAIKEALAAPERFIASQATSIEQSRAVAEVQAMVVVAQRMPRDVPRALQQIKESCGLLTLAERAFYKFPRGGQSVTGPSIQLATELARCWGNINYGVSELARNDERGESEMLAFAWDVQTNVRPSTSFIVPHKRDKKGGPEVLTDMRDIYENNANNAARRLREMIFRALPSWLVADAQEWCRATLENGESDVPLPKRIASMIEVFGELGISRDRIEARLGVKADVLTPVDLANLKVSYLSLKRGEVDAEEEFPTVKAAAVTEALKASAPPAAEKKDAAPKDVPVLGTKPADDSEVEALIEEGDEAEQEAERRRSRLDDIIAELDNMRTRADVEEYAKHIAADLQLMTDAERGRFVSAKLGRLQKLPVPKAKS